MLNFFKKRLDAKFVFFQLNKLMVQTIYELRKHSLEDKRKNKNNGDLKVNACHNETAALVFFLSSQAIQLTKLDPKLSTCLISMLKGYCMAYMPSLEKEQQQLFLEDRSADYFETFKDGFSEAAICSLFLDFLGIQQNQSQILENFSYSGIIDNTFFGMIEIITITQKHCKIVSGSKISQEEWSAHRKELDTFKPPNNSASPKDVMAAKYKEFSDNLKRKGTYDDQISAGYGSFGLTKTNPIPMTSTQATIRYLDSLKLANGRSITYKRLGSISAPEVTEGMIDMYNVHSDGETVATIYFCPYHNKDSERIPDGFETIVSS